MEKSIHIILSEIEGNFEGEELGFIDDQLLSSLHKLVLESEKLNKTAEKISSKKEQALRHSNKLMKRIIESHRVQYDLENESVGISDEDVIYVGEKERIINNPNADPSNEDIIKGKLTKYERRKYSELLDTFKYLNEKANEHNYNVLTNENNLIDFENKFLADKEYSKEDDYLVVFSKTKKIVLCRR